MAATAAQIAQMRRMVNESDDTTYDDDALAGYIETHPLLDERGEEPYTWDTSTSPPTQEENEDWVPTYDLHAVAADIWEEKAAALVERVDVGMGPRNERLSQQYEQAMKQARYHRSRRSARTITLYKWPEESETGRQVWVGNLAEEDD